MHRHYKARRRHKLTHTPHPAIKGRSSFNMVTWTEEELKLDAEIEAEKQKNKVRLIYIHIYTPTRS